MVKKFILLPVFGLGGMALLFAATSRYGAGIGPDSVVYLSAAENFLKGLGFSALSGTGEMGPMTRFPPLFPALLAAAGALGVPLAAAARWLNIVIFGANIMLAGALVGKYTASPRLAAFTALLMMLSVDMLHVHSMVMTEAIFVFFTLLTAFYSVEHYESGRAFPLAAAAGAAALAVLARYSGAALVAASAAGMLFFSREARLRTRFANAAIFTGLSLLPILLWVWRNFIVTGSAADRAFVFHPIPPHKIYQAGLTCAGWLAPVKYSAAAGIFILILEAAALAVLCRLLQKSQALGGKSLGQHFFRLPAFLALFISCYAALLAVSLYFFDAATPLNSRILSPMYTAGLVLAASMAYRVSYPIRNTGTVKAIVSALATLLAGYYLFSAAVWAADIYANGQRYNGREWAQSELMNTVRSLPAGTLIYTNGPDVIGLLTGRQARRIPAKAKQQTRLSSGSYMYELSRMQEELGKNSGVIVYFNKITARWYLPSEAELKKQLPLTRLTDNADGSVYAVAASRR